MTLYTEADLVGLQAGVVGVAAFQIGVDIEVVQPAVGIVIGRVVEVAVAEHDVIDAFVSTGDQCPVGVQRRRIVDGLVVEQRVALDSADQCAGLGFALAFAAWLGWIWLVADAPQRQTQVTGTLAGGVIAAASLPAPMGMIITSRSGTCSMISKNSVATFPFPVTRARDLRLK